MIPSFSSSCVTLCVREKVCVSPAAMLPIGSYKSPSSEERYMLFASVWDAFVIVKVRVTSSGCTISSGRASMPISSIMPPDSAFAPQSMPNKIRSEHSAARQNRSVRIIIRIPISPAFCRKSFQSTLLYYYCMTSTRMCQVNAGGKRNESICGFPGIRSAICRRPS